FYLLGSNHPDPTQSPIVTGHLFSEKSSLFALVSLRRRLATLLHLPISRRRAIHFNSTDVFARSSLAKATFPSCPFLVARKFPCSQPSSFIPARTIRSAISKSVMARS